MMLELQIRLFKKMSPSNHCLVVWQEIACMEDGSHVFDYEVIIGDNGYANYLQFDSLDRQSKYLCSTAQVVPLLINLLDRIQQ